jgi:hypothetical protein
MPDGCRFPVSVCIAASVSAMNMTSWPIGSWPFGWSGFCPLILTAFFRYASAETERRRPKTAREPGLISSGWIGTQATYVSAGLVHLTMRLTVLTQTAKGLPEKIGKGEDCYELRPEVLRDLERIKWYLWHGNVFQACRAWKWIWMQRLRNS